jgi:hypothetical protein
VIVLAPKTSESPLAGSVDQFAAALQDPLVGLALHVSVAARAEWLKPSATTKMLSAIYLSGSHVSPVERRAGGNPPERRLHWLPMPNWAGRQLAGDVRLFMDMVLGRVGL